MMTETNDANGRELTLLRAGAHTLGIFADETEGAVEFKSATPLPFAPPAVLGVIAARGRMRTLINPLPLVEPDAGQPQASATPDAAPRVAILLRGDEQLALAVESVERTIEVATEEISPPDPAQSFTRGSVTRDGTHILILNPNTLFAAAMRGAERRRRR